MNGNYPRVILALNETKGIGIVVGFDVGDDGEFAVADAARVRARLGRRRVRLGRIQHVDRCLRNDLQSMILTTSLFILDVISVVTSNDFQVISLWEIVVVGSLII